MNYHPFVIPLCLGVIILFTTLAYKYLYWIFTLNKSDKFKILKGIFSVNIFKACKKVVLECLIHRKVWRVNPLLGYMHMTFALGWLLLIIGGTIESKIHSHKPFNAPYEPVFFKFFNHNISQYAWAKEFQFVMDFLLLFILSGLTLALIKRIYSRLFGMKKTTKLRIGDRLAMTTLWFIFPLRFCAESITSGLYHNGGFLTDNAGKIFTAFLSPHSMQSMYFVAWWAYSSVLCIFFIALPYSRYMHIFTEAVLIFLQNFGIKNCKVFNSFSAVEVYSCSRCGICIDKCQLLTSARIKDTQSVYFLYDVRANTVRESIAYNCLLCGRCQEFCPVGINLNNIRISKRIDFSLGYRNFDYIEEKVERTAPVIYFAGCMTHLTPSIKHSMEAIFHSSETDYIFLDKDGTICCGRPLMMAGEILKAHKLVEKNRKLIKDSGAITLVTSCPICLTVFKEDYLLNIEVLHHSQFILRLEQEGRIHLNKSELKAVYHDPCELGRGCNVYKEPRQLLKKLVELQSIKNEAEYGLCCGSSIGGLQLSSVQKDHIRIDTLAALQKPEHDLIITACPLCKKTLSKGADSDVRDIAEVVVEGMKQVETVNGH